MLQQHGSTILTKGSLWDKAANRETVFSRELNQIKDAGNVKKGDPYTHPDNP